MAMAQITRHALSSAQASIWFAQQLEPENAVFNTAEYVEINGPVSLALWERAVKQAVREADGLHVRFGEDQDGPFQIMGPQGDLHIQVIDYSATENPVQAAQAHMDKDYTQPVNLQKDPLYTQILFKLAEDRYFWYQRMHHIIADGYAFYLMVQRVAKIYTGLINGLSSQDDAFQSLESVLQADKAYQASPQKEQDHAFWTDRFSDRPEVASLTASALTDVSKWPIKYASKTPSVITKHFLKGNWHEKMIAAIAAYLHRFTGKQDIILGLPMMNRMGTSALNVPAMVMNQLPLRLNVSPDQSFSDLVRQVTKELSEVRPHASYRHEQMRRDFQLIGNNERLFGPFVNIMPFDIGYDFAGSKGITNRLATGPVEDIAIQIFAGTQHDGWSIELAANPGLYTLEALETHHRHFLSLLEQVAANDDVIIGALALLSTIEQKQILQDVNNTEHKVANVTLAQLVEDQVKRGRNQTALICGTEKVTYQTLNERANQLGHLLVEREVGQGDYVAVAMHRSIEMVVAMLAIVKTGAAFLPIDPDYPADRIAFMLKEVDPVCIVTEQEIAADLPYDTSCN